MNENVLWVVLCVLALFLGSMVWMGIRSQRYNTTFESSLTAGKSTSFLLITASAMGAHIGSGFVVGSAEYGAGYGIGGAWYGICCGLSFVVAGLFLSRVFRSLGCISISQYLQTRYHDNVTPLIYSVSNVFSGISIIAGQLLAGKALFSAVGFDGTSGVIILAVVAFIFVSLSGMWGVLAASAVQTAVIAAGMIIALAVTVAQHGTSIITQSLPSSYFSIQPYDPETFVQLTVPTLVFAQISQFAFQRFVSADSEHSARLGHVLGGLILIPLAMIPTVLGMYGRVLFPSGPDGEVFIDLVATYLPVLVSGVLIAAILCAVISSCNGTFLMINTCLIHDIWKGICCPNASDRSMHLLSTLCNGVVCLIGIALALTDSHILVMMSFGYTFMISGCLIPFFGGIVWKRPGAKAAIASSAVGILTSAVYVFDLLPIPFGSIFPVIPSLVAYVVAGWLSGREK